MVINFTLTPSQSANLKDKPRSLPVVMRSCGRHRVVNSSVCGSLLKNESLLHSADDDLQSKKPRFNSFPRSVWTPVRLCANIIKCTELSVQKVESIKSCFHWFLYLYMSEFGNTVVEYRCVFFSRAEIARGHRVAFASLVAIVSLVFWNGSSAMLYVLFSSSSSSSSAYYSDEGRIVTCSVFTIRVAAKKISAHKSFKIKRRHAWRVWGGPRTCILLFPHRAHL